MWKYVQTILEIYIEKSRNIEKYLGIYREKSKNIYRRNSRKIFWKI